MTGSRDDTAANTAVVAAGTARWLTIHDDLLRGLAHAVSNRLATITAAASVLDASLLPDPRFLDGMRVDAERLDGLLQLLRLLPRRGDAELEPMLFTDALDSARRLVEEHPTMRGRDITVVLEGDVMPVRAEPGAVLHASCVALLAAARVGTGLIEATLRTVGDEVQCVVRCAPSADERLSDELLEHDAQAIGWLLSRSQGRAHIHADGCTVILPTLQASRRRTT